MSEAIEVLTPVGRVVGGHPMESRPVTDEVTRQPKLDSTSQPMIDHYLALAIPKQGEQNWTQTEWGAKIYQAAVAGWPAGEYNAPTFAWKIVDGDSQTPNKAGKIPCQREGWAGHWVLHLSTGLPIRCYHVGKYEPHLQIQNKDEIKPGDYGRVCISARANAPSKSPGVYLNPQMFELSRAGQRIILESGPDAGAVFGAAAPQVPTNAQVDTAVQAPGTTTPPPVQAPVSPPATQSAGAVPPPAQPHENFLNPQGATPPPPPTERRFNVGGTVYTEAQLVTAGWSSEQINAATPV